MRAVVQRVRECSVTIAGKPHSGIGPGILVLLGIGREDTKAAATTLAQKIAAMRIFDDGSGKMNLSLVDVKGSAMVVSEFTLYGDASKGNRPSYHEAAEAGMAEQLYGSFVEEMKRIAGPDKISTGVFRSMMDIALVNDGPVTLILNTP